MFCYYAANYDTCTVKCELRMMISSKT